MGGTFKRYQAWYIRGFRFGKEWDDLGWGVDTLGVRSTIQWNMGFWKKFDNYVELVIMSYTS